MDSPPIGSPNVSMELLRIETNLFNLYIQGKPFHPTVDTLQLHRTSDNQLLPAHLHIAAPSTSLDIENISIFNPETKELYRVADGRDRHTHSSSRRKSYELVIEKKQDIPLSFYHENVHIQTSGEATWKRQYSRWDSQFSE